MLRYANVSLFKVFFPGSSCVTSFRGVPLFCVAPVIAITGAGVCGRYGTGGTLDVPCLMF